MNWALMTLPKTDDELIFDFCLGWSDPFPDFNGLVVTPGRELMPGLPKDCARFAGYSPAGAFPSKKMVSGVVRAEGTSDQVTFGAAT